MKFFFVCTWHQDQWSRCCSSWFPKEFCFASYSVQDIEFAALHQGFHPQAVLQLEELTAGGNAQRLFEVAFGGSEILEPKVRWLTWLFTGGKLFQNVRRCKNIIVICGCTTWLSKNQRIVNEPLFLKRVAYNSWLGLYRMNKPSKKGVILVWLQIIGLSTWTS